MRRPSLKLSARTKKILLRIFVGFAVVYFSIGGFIWWSMRQPPEQFGKVMMHIPGPVPFLLFSV